MYYKGPDDEIKSMGELSLTTFVDTPLPSIGDVGSATHTQPSPAIDDCSINMHCAREDPPTVTGPCDIQGVVGGVCSHGIPLKGLFVDMHAAEQFIYYLVIFCHLLRLCLEKGVAVRDVYVDFGCRLSKTWSRFISKQPQKLAAGTHDMAASLRIIVNWMHGSSHDLACQLKNNGRYISNAGRKVGENSEQLWSMIKVFPLL